MEAISTDSLKPETSFTGDLMLDSTFLLLPHPVDVTSALINALKEWKFDSVLCEGDLSIGGEIDLGTAEIELEPAKPDEKIGKNIKKAIENSKHYIFDSSEQSRLNAVQEVYDEYMNYIENVFTHYSTHKQIDQGDLSETVQQLCIFIKENRRYILRLAQDSPKNKRNFMINHAMRVTVLSIAIALQLRMPLSKMIDLGVTSILHEIGMLRLPPQLYNTTKKLTQGQRSQIARHTLFGYTIIKELNFAPQIQLGVLEHHEKENGMGYPRHLPGEKIEPIAKIISVACSYEAISSPRSYRDERSTFDALLEMIQNRERAYDDMVLKALLYTVSLYPIGTYVYLSNRKIGVVIDSNEKNPKCPIVQMINEKEADGSAKTVQTSPELSILRILSKQEKEDIIKLLEQKENAIAEAKKIIQENSAENKAYRAAVSENNLSAPKTAHTAAESQLQKAAAQNIAAPAANVPQEQSQQKSESVEEEIDISFFN